jgi:hypothetical protein
MFRSFPTFHQFNPKTQRRINLHKAHMTRHGLTPHLDRQTTRLTGTRQVYRDAIWLGYQV